MYHELLMDACLQYAITEMDGAQLPELFPQWSVLLTRSYDNRLFLTPTWYRVWCDQFGAGQARLITAREGDRLAGLLPLSEHGDGSVRTLTLLGDPEVMDYMDGLADRDAAPDILRRMWDHALSHGSWDRIELRHVPSASPLIDAVREAVERNGGSVTVELDEVDPVVMLCPTWDAYLGTLTKKHRHELRRKLRRAQEGATWERRTTRTLAELDRDLPAFFRLHEASAHDKATFMTPAMRSFFRAMCAAFLHEGILRLAISRRDGIDVAATLSFLYRGRYLLYNSGYDPEFAFASPGIAGVAGALQDAIAEEAVVFDFLSGNEPYKYQLGATDTSTCRVVATAGR